MIPVKGPINAMLSAPSSLLAAWPSANRRMDTRSLTVASAVLLSLAALTFTVLTELSRNSTSPYYPSSPMRRLPQAAWNGYSQLVRTTSPTNSSAASPAFPIAPIPALRAFFSSVPRFFQRFLQRTAPPPGPPLPHAFRTDTVAGVPIAYHNPFPPDRLAGVALLFHACRQTATDWFTLPEHRRLSAELLRRRLALLAVASANRRTGCWSTRHPASDNVDAARVRLAVRQWLSTHGVSARAPTYAVGVSSGATFLSVLASASPPLVPRLAAQALYLSPGNPRALRAAAPRFPATLFVRGADDAGTHSASVVAMSPHDVAAARTALLGRAPHVVVAELPLPRPRWTADILAQHEPRLTQMASEALFHAALQCDGELRCAVKRAANASVDAMWADAELRRAVVQVSRVLSGQHEMSGVHADLVADWLVRHGRRAPQRWHDVRT